jgi:PhzF family phenazine biosynthesis protein
MGLLAARMAAFSDDPRGGNPAGVVVGDAFPTDDEMQGLARDIGYSETVFLTGDGGSEWKARYWSPLSEVPFCGHATIAAAVAIHRQYGLPELLLDTLAGPVPVAVEDIGGAPWATLTSVEPRVSEIAPEELGRLLELLRLAESDLDPALPPKVAYAGVSHPVVALASRDALSALEYDFEGLRTLMEERDWTTIQVVWQSSPTQFRARDPFPVGGVVEDPATGAAAAALGAYLREIGAIAPPASIEILQGEEIGRPSRIFVAIPTEGGIGVTGTAVPIPPDLA